MQWHTDNKTDREFAHIPGIIFIFYVEDVEDVNSNTLKVLTYTQAKKHTVITAMNLLRTIIMKKLQVLKCQVAR